ncbi:hypothetical protein ACPV5R_18330 [Vibrio astriarenae]
MRSFVLAAATGMLLVGCGNDGDSFGGAGNYTNEQVGLAVKCSNQAEGGLCEENSSGNTWSTMTNTDYCGSGIYCFEDGHTPPTDPSLTRFVEGELIPVYFREREDSRFSRSMNYFEDLVGYQIFDRRGAVDIDISDPNNVDLTHLPTDWGFILSQGTSIGDPFGQGYCSSGGVSVGPFSYSMTSHIVSVADYGIKYPAKKWGRDHKFTWVNIDSVSGANNGSVNCSQKAGQDVTHHEFAHAMGMYNHFSGFGFNGAWGKNAERVFKTMYSQQNPPGQPFDALNIEN